MKKIIRKNQTNHIKLSPTKDIYQYFTNEDNPNVSIATIEGNGKYEKAEATSNFYYYIIEGEITLEFKDENVKLSAGDGIMINKGEIYNMDGNYRILLVCEPAFK